MSGESVIDNQSSVRFVDVRGDLIAYNYKTQAVVAVALKNESGAGHWPVCG